MKRVIALFFGLGIVSTLLVQAQAVTLSNWARSKLRGARSWESFCAIRLWWILRPPVERSRRHPTWHFRLI
jgi:hypothetical protein